MLDCVAAMLQLLAMRVEAWERCALGAWLRCGQSAIFIFDLLIEDGKDYRTSK